MILLALAYSLFRRHKRPPTELEAGQATLNDLASGAPEETLEKVRELGEAGAKVMEGDSEEGKRALEEFAARFNTDMSAELEAVWTECECSCACVQDCLCTRAVVSTWKRRILLDATHTPTLCNARGHLVCDVGL